MSEKECGYECHSCDERCPFNDDGDKHPEELSWHGQAHFFKGEVTRLRSSLSQAEEMLKERQKGIREYTRETEAEITRLRVREEALVHQLQESAEVEGLALKAVEALQAEARAWRVEFSLRHLGRAHGFRPCDICVAGRAVKMAVEAMKAAKDKEG